MIWKPTLSEETSDGIDVHAIGVLHELLFAYRCIQLGMWQTACGRLRRVPRMWSRRNAWNGFMAEPMKSGLCTRAGCGWTRRRALADLKRQMREAQR